MADGISLEQLASLFGISGDRLDVLRQILGQVSTAQPPRQAMPAEQQLGSLAPPGADAGPDLMTRAAVGLGAADTFDMRDRIAAALRNVVPTPDLGKRESILASQSVMPGVSTPAWLQAVQQSQLGIGPGDIGAAGVGAISPRAAQSKWWNVDRPALESTYGDLTRQRFDAPRSQRLTNTPEVVNQRATLAEDFLAQPTEPWVPKEYAFPRASIQDALEGFPGQEQTRFTRYTPTERTSLEHVNAVYEDPRNRELIKKQIARGLPLGGETFYASLWPLLQEAQGAGIPRASVESWIQSVAPSSARNSIMNENTVGNLLYGMNKRGIPLTPENVDAEMALFKQRYGTGVPLMPVHTQGTARILEGGESLRDRMTRALLRASDAPEYKIGTYGLQKSGDFAKSWVGDVHEAAGETLGSIYHPYWKEAGGFNPSEYGAAEGHMLNIANEMGIPGGTAQAGRWFGGGELTGLKSPRGDALDMLEKQVAYTMNARGMPVTPRGVREYTFNLIRQGGDLLPWFRKSGLPDVRF